MDYILLLGHTNNLYYTEALGAIRGGEIHRHSAVVMTLSLKQRSIVDFRHSNIITRILVPTRVKRVYSLYSVGHDLERFAQRVIDRGRSLYNHILLLLYTSSPSYISKRPCI